MTPVVSILMTSFNREKFIAESIESVLKSSYEDFELIILDDCSVDKTYFLAKEFEGYDKRVKVFRNTKNLGQFTNRNKIATLARGKYLKYLDSDDILYPYALEMMVKAIEMFPDAGLGFCLTHGPCKKPLPYLIRQKDAYYQHFFEGGLLFVGPSGMIIRKEAFERVGGFEEYGMPSDNHFALKIAAIYPVIAMTRDLFWWRMHEDQVTTHNKKNHNNIINNFQYTKDLIRNCSPLPHRLNKKILFNMKKNFLKHVLRFVFKKQRPDIALSLLLNINRKIHR